jgi:DNA polymerase III subunit delta
VKVSANQLGAELRRALAPVYIVSGDEPLLVSEAAEAIRAQALAAGFAERQIYYAERGFDWNQLRDASVSLSLFAERRLIELRLATPSPGEEGTAELTEHAQRAPADTLLLVTCPRLDRKTATSRWVTALERIGVLVEIRSVGVRELGGWIERRMRAAQLEPTSAAVELLAERVEGNLLAAAQEIEKLRLLHGPGALDDAAVRDAVADSSRYDAFQLVDAALAGDAARALRILDGLRAEGVEPPLLIWALSRDLRALAALAWERATRKRSKVAGAIWQSRRRQLEAAQGRATLREWHALVLRAGEVDAIVKGRAQGQPWAAMTGLVAAFAGAAAA